MEINQENQPKIICGKVDKGVLFSVIFLTVIGALMILSASSIRALQNYGDLYYFFRRQLIFIVTGLIFMFIFSHINYRNYLYHSRKLILLSLGMLVVVLIPAFGISIHGSRRWLNFGFFNFQPSEFTKLAVVIYISSFIYRKKTQIKSFSQGILPPMIVVSAMFFLISQQPDMGTAVTLFIVAILLLIIGGVKISHLFIIGMPGSTLLIYYITSASYRMNRILTFLDPWRDPRGAGYHIIQSLLALGSGGITGVGPGGSRQKFLYLPEPGTDFIFAIIGEELGLIGAAGVVLLFAYLTYSGIKISINAPDIFGSMLAAGLTLMIIIQVFINIGAVTALLPVTGITLPFISYGGSSLLIMMISTGILLNISRYEIAEGE